MDTEKVCTQCGRHCVPAQSYCPKCGSALPAATPVLAPSGSSLKLILNKGEEEKILEFEDIEQAFNEAQPWIMKGYSARITDKQGVVKFTQALANGQIATYPDDATGPQPVANQEQSRFPMPTSRQPAQAAESKGEHEKAGLPKRAWW